MGWMLVGHVAVVGKSPSPRVRLGLNPVVVGSRAAKALLKL